MKWQKFRVWAVLSVLLAASVAVPSMALTDAQWDFFDANGIFYYDPDGRNGSSSCLPGSNTDYSGAQVLTSAMSGAIQANQAFYKEAADKYGFDWRIIAAIHVMENSATRSNPDNGQGAYQLYSYTAGGTNSNAFLPAGQISDDEFQRQTDIMAGLLINNYGAGLDLSTPAGVKTLFFKYNGAAPKYVDKAIAMGFSDADARTGEGSPYVMNKYDAARDPGSSSMSPHWPGRYVGDRQWSDTSTSPRPGAYTIYVALGGTDGGSSNICYIAGAGGGRLVAGANGMTLQEAQAFMQAYKDAVRGVSNADLKTLYGMTDNSCTGGVAYNCVSFSRFFINMYTNDYIANHITVGLGNGADIVGALLGGGYAFTDGGNTPQVYAVFSTSSGSTMCGDRACGHTGVVLGINTETDTIIIGEASCGSGEAGIQAREASLSTFMSSSYRYAYPNSLNFPSGTITPGSTPDPALHSVAGEQATVAIPGLSRNYKIAWVSDMHIIADGAAYVGQGRYDMFVNSEGVHSADYWESVINYLNNSGFDAVVFGGDIADYYSNANYQTIRNGLNRLTMPWFYIVGGEDHDLYSGRTGDSPSSSLTSDSSAGAGDVIDMGEFKIIGLNNSSNRNISSSELDEVASKIKNAGKPVILVTHVPFESQVSSLMPTVKAVHNDQAYYWTNGSYSWDYADNPAMKDFADANLYSDSTNVKAVLAGHVHELSDDRQLTALVKQHIFHASYKGQIGVIYVRGN